MTDPGDRLPSGPAWAPGYRHVTEGPPLAFETRAELEDFLVAEIPLHEPAGTGSHVWFEIEKRGLATAAAVRRIARALGVAPHAIGWAGRKDARAVARQWLSVEHVAPETVRALALPGIRVLAAERAERKLKLGQLAGNRFKLRLRGLAPGASTQVGERLAVLEEHGLANYYGEQRFGWSGQAYELGRHLVRRDFEAYLARLCLPEEALRPGPAEASAANPRVGGRAEALACFLDALAGAELPRSRTEDVIRALGPDLAGLVRAVARGERDAGALAARVPRRLARLHVSAFAARIFNDVLSARLARVAHLGRLEPGDVAYLHANGAAFVVPLDLEPTAEAGRADGFESLDALDARARAFELSPSGPMAGARLLEPIGAPGRREAEAFAGHGVGAADFGRIGLGLDQRGTRRPLRVRLEDLSVCEVDSDLVLEFRLPAGAFATTLLEELERRWAGPSRS